MTYFCKILALGRGRKRRGGGKNVVLEHSQAIACMCLEICERPLRFNKQPMNIAHSPQLDMAYHS